MASLDLDARRQEYEDQRHTVTLGGQEWTLPAKFPLIAAEYLQGGELERTVRTLFGDDAVEVVTPLLNDDDLNAILGELYGLNPEGEAKPVALVKANGNRAQRRTAKT